MGLVTPAGAIRIQTIGVFSPFVRFMTPDGRELLVAPETIALSIQVLPPESGEPRFPIGFAQPERGEPPREAEPEG